MGDVKREGVEFFRFYSFIFYEISFPSRRRFVLLSFKILPRRNQTRDKNVETIHKYI